MDTNFFQIIEVKTEKRVKLYAAIPKWFTNTKFAELRYNGGTRPVIQLGYPRVLAFVNTSPEKAIEHALEYFKSFNLDINLIANWMTNYDDWKYLGQSSPEYNSAPKELTVRK